MKNFSKVSATFFTLLVGTILSANGEIKLKSCYGGLLPIQVKISGCNSSPCEFKFNTKAEFEVTFKGPYAVQYIESKGILTNPHYRLYPITLNEKYSSKLYELFEKDTNANVSLPLEKNTEYVYKDSFQVSKTYSTGEFELRWALEDDFVDQYFVCFQTSIKIVAE